MALAGHVMDILGQSAFGSTLSGATRSVEGTGVRI